MSNMSDYLESQLRNHIFRTAAYPKPSGLYVSLHTASPTEAGGAGEVVGGSYARVSHGPADSVWSAGGATDGLTSNVTAITFAVATASWGTITHVGIYDAPTGGNLLFHGALVLSMVVGVGSPAVVFSPGALQVQFA